MRSGYRRRSRPDGALRGSACHRASSWVHPCGITCGPLRRAPRPGTSTCASPCRFPAPLPFCLVIVDGLGYLQLRDLLDAARCRTSPRAYSKGARVPFGHRRCHAVWGGVGSVPFRPDSGARRHPAPRRPIPSLASQGGQILAPVGPSVEDPLLRGRRCWSPSSVLDHDMSLYGMNLPSSTSSAIAYVRVKSFSSSCLSCGAVSP